MKVKDLIADLSEYNPEAEINVVAHCRDFKFSLSYGSSEMCNKKNCETVSVYADELCTTEKTNEWEKK